MKIGKLLLLAFLVRIFFIYFQYSGDVLNHLVWGKEALQHLNQFYSQQLPGFNTPNYPPVTIYLFAISVWLYNLFNQAVTFLNQSIQIFPSAFIPLAQTLNMQTAFLKLPAILADIGIGWLIYRLSSSFLLTVFYLFNPAVIYISTVWGQIESVPIFFTLLSLYTIKKHYLFSHIFFTLAILSKQTALWLLPIFLILWLKDKPLKAFLQGASLQVTLFILLYLPFTRNFISPFTLYLQTLAGSSNLATDAAWNIWHFLYPAGTPDSTPLFHQISIRSWSVLLLLISTMLITFKLIKNKLTLYQALFWLSAAVFFLQTRVHERHLFPALVFFILTLKPQMSTLKIVGFLSLTLFHLFNLYWSLGLPFI